MLPHSELRKLGGSRWAVPLLAMLSREGGARFAAMAAQYSLSHSSLSRALDHLAACGWVVPNPGHGHPLRPEYVPTGSGLAVGAACERILASRQRLGLDQRDLTRWSLPVLAELAPDWTRFNDIQAALDPITPRALSLTLKTMIGHDIVTRRLGGQFPLFPLYGLTERGRDFAQALAA